ncbi:hypothetical protein SAMN05720473_101775 [Fibrobacter sp. UWB15]|nr:hypothetical protein BGW99_101775 [Fibrobacter sp. UWB6]SHF81236.1 hypothetical protein SAMN05720760_101740 [Fibrobacter sp. UWB8]SMG16055.1 hypothetical protein SAMN05720473_101775 [Fibrobacter sp. UWB15]
MIKSTSTFDRIMADPKQKGTFEKEYANFLQSEMKLQNALAEGERSAEQGCWLSAADVRKKF